MPDGNFEYLIKEAYRKISLAKIVTKSKGKELLDRVIEDLIAIEGIWNQYKKNLEK